MRIDPRDPKSRPADLAERFKPGKYDVYILGDIDSTAFHGDELADLAECVNRGAGLIMLGGFQSFGPGGYGDTPLAKVLPVGMDRLERQQPDEPIAHRPALARPAADAAHAAGPDALRPDAGRQPRRRTPRCGRSCRRWTGPTSSTTWPPGPSCWPTPAPDKPLLVAHNFGDGRVMAFAGDSTWRWWMHGYESAHKRFWRQIVLWLARKDQAQEGNVWVRLGAAALRAGAAGGVHRRGHRRPPASRSPTPPSRPRSSCPTAPAGRCRWSRQDEQMAGSFRDTQTAGDYAIEVTASAEGPAAGHAPGRGSWSSSRTSNSTTPRPTPPRWRAWPR